MTFEEKRKAINDLRNMAIPEDSPLYSSINLAIEAIANYDSTEKVGHWVFVKGYEGILYECTACKNKNTHTTIRWNYCPHCGAKMEVKE